MTTSLGTSSALVPCSPPPWTAAMSRNSPVPRPRRDQAEDDDGRGGEQPSRREADLGGRVAEAADQRTEGDPDLEHDPGEQDDTADANDAGDRCGGLGDPEAGERNPAEWPHEAQRLGQCVGEWSSDRAPPRPASPARRRRGRARRPFVAAKYPGAVSCHIHAIPVASQAKAKTNPSRKRRRRDGRSPTASSKTAMPMNASGHHPHGGSARATRRPPARATSARQGVVKPMRPSMSSSSSGAVGRPAPASQDRRGRGRRRCARRPTPAGGRRTASPRGGSPG